MAFVLVLPREPTSAEKQHRPDPYQAPISCWHIRKSSQRAQAAGAGSLGLSLGPQGPLLRATDYCNAFSLIHPQIRHEMRILPILPLSKAQLLDHQLPD